jgi:hypothetical protein
MTNALVIIRDPLVIVIDTSPLVFTHFAIVR